MSGSRVAAQAVRAQAAARVLGTVRREDKDRALELMAQALLRRAAEVERANQEDEERAREEGLTGPMLARLSFDRRRLERVVAGIADVRALPDPVGEVVEEHVRPDGLVIRKVRVPMGVIAMIYEARPNVTVDAAALCLKAGSAVLLRGGSEAVETNRVLVEAMREALTQAGLPADAVQMVEDTSREAAVELMRLRGLVDLLIPRGGAGLIGRVLEEARVPVIETGVGNCHVFVDRAADLDQAVRIAVNAKVSNPAVCNAAETLLVHRAVADAFLPRLAAAVAPYRVELRGCADTRAILPEALPASEADWDTEFLDLVYAVRVVDSLDEAIAHINRHGTRHSEAIVTEDTERARRFLTEVDAAAVYHNASTRFTDGYEFGLVAEIGISTQKLHARGPMGLREICSTKYVVLGQGQVRE